jgi:hypothetical protein
MKEEFVTEALKLPPEYIKRGYKAARKAHGGGMTKAAWESFDDETKAKIKKQAIAIAFSLHKKAKANARKVKKESIEEGKALSFQQRLVRARQMRRIEPKVYRGQIRYQDRVPSQARLEKRAERMARNVIKMRISHTPYDQMSIPEKIMIDKILEKKQKAIKKLAQRLLPKVRKISMQRISGSQIPIQTVQYQSTDYDDTLSMIESKLSNVEDNNLKESLQTIIALSTNEETAAVQSLRKKADVAKVSFEEIVSVYAEAVSEYTPQKITSEQYAFNAVNAFVSDTVNQLAENMFIGPPTDPINLAVELVNTTGVKSAIPVATKVAVDSAKTTMAALRSKAKEKK